MNAANYKLEEKKYYKKPTSLKHMIIAGLLEIQEKNNFEGSIEDIMNNMVIIYGKDQVCK